jgi:hypothetical protein
MGRLRLAPGDDAGERFGGVGDAGDSVEQGGQADDPSEGEINDIQGGRGRSGAVNDGPGEFVVVVSPT